jgi:predicted NBD/HSP70 family sugar kinase
LVTSLGTEIVVIGGGLSSALDIMTPVIEAPIRERAAIIGDCRVVASSLGLHAGAIGAALWKENT